MTALSELPDPRFDELEHPVTVCPDGAGEHGGSAAATRGAAVEKRSLELPARHRSMPRLGSSSTGRKAARSPAGGDRAALLRGLFGVGDRGDVAVPSGNGQVTRGRVLLNDCERS